MGNERPPIAHEITREGGGTGRRASLRFESGAAREQENSQIREDEQTPTDARGPLMGNPVGNQRHVAEAWDRALAAALEATADDLATTLTAPGDAVEAALADAVQRAAQAGQWAAVEALARELEARRRACAGVTELASLATAAGEPGPRHPWRV